jgi:glucosylglycerate synthase
VTLGVDKPKDKKSMANLEAAEEKQTASAPAETADLIIGIPAATDAEQLRRRASEALQGLIASTPSLKVLVAYPGNPSIDGIEDAGTSRETSLRFLEYSLPPGAPAGVPWLAFSAAYAMLREIAERAGATKCIVLGADLAMLNAGSVRLLAQPLLDDRAELVMPAYPASKYEGLLNSAILYPFTRALYGKRVRYPLASDFGVSTRILGQAAEQPARSGQSSAIESVVWPATAGAISEVQIVQGYLDERHTAQNDSLDLSTVLSHLVGSLFSDVEQNAVFWQRVRGSQQLPAVGSPVTPTDGGDPVDIRPMLDSFNLGSRNLQEIWSLVLPPVTLLELKRLSRVTPDQFRLPDALWVRIIYDFALAYRLRTISRAHLLGALTPLYLGWVASYVQEISSASTYLAEQRIEQLAKAYEDGKPYLVSRWRWPDRFNP